MTVRTFPAARLVATWTDLDCGCTHNEHDSWIVRSSCIVHRALAPHWQDALRFYGESSGDIGPFQL